MLLHHPIRTLLLTFLSGIMVGFAASGGAGAAAAAAYLDMKSKGDANGQRDGWATRAR